MKSLTTGEYLDKPKTRVVPPPRVDEMKEIAETSKKSTYIQQQHLDLFRKEIDENKKDVQFSKVVAVVSIIIAVVSLVVAIIAL